MTDLSFLPELTSWLTRAFLLLIVIVLVLGWWWQTRPLARATSALRHRRLAVSKLAEELGPDPQTNAGDRRLSEDLRERARLVLGDLTFLEPSFRRFLRAWRESYLDKRGAALGEIRFEDFLPLEVLVTSVSNRRMAQAIPGVLVALGILGTFVGLVLALPLAGPSSHTISDFQDLQAVVEGITGGLGVAFYTSIAGIGCSVLFLFLDRRALHRLEREYLLLLDELHNVFPTLSASEVAKLTYEQLENTCVAIEQMGTDLATKLADSLSIELGRVMEAHFAPHATRVAEAVGSLVSATAEGHAEALGKLVDRFLTGAREALGDEFGDLRESMRLAAESQTVFRQSLEAFGEKLAETTVAHTHLLESTARAGQSLVQSLDRLEAISASLGSSADQLTVAAENTHKAADIAAAAYELASQGLQRLLDGMESQLTLLNEARKLLLQSWEDSLKKAEEAVFRIRDIARELETGIPEHLVAALKQFDFALAEALRRFGATLADLQETVEGLPSLLLKMDEATTAIRGEVESLKEAIQRIERLVSGEIFGGVERAAETASRLENVVTTTQTLLQWSGILQERFAETVQALTAQHAGTEQATADLHRTEAVVKDLNIELLQLNSQLQRLQTHLEGDGSLGHLRRSLDNLSRNLDSFSERFSVVRSASESQSSASFLAKFLNLKR